MLICFVFTLIITTVGFFIGFDYGKQTGRREARQWYSELQDFR